MWPWLHAILHRWISRLRPYSLTQYVFFACGPDGTSTQAHNGLHTAITLLTFPLGGLEAFGCYVVVLPGSVVAQ